MILSRSAACDDGGGDRVVHEADQRVDARDLGRELQLGRVVAEHADLEVRLERAEGLGQLARREDRRRPSPALRCSAWPAKKIAAPMPSSSSSRRESWPRTPDEEARLPPRRARETGLAAAQRVHLPPLRARRDAGDPVALLDAQDDVHPRDDLRRRPCSRRPGAAAAPASRTTGCRPCPGPTSAMPTVAAAYGSVFELVADLVARPAVAGARRVAVLDDEVRARRGGSGAPSK